jgi:predicted nucleic acid-binding protein
VYLVDTDVLSELRRVRSGRADPRVVAWAEATPAAELFVSVIVLQEIEIGVLLMERRDPGQGAVLRRWYEGAVLSGFEGRVLPVDTAVARRSARLHVPDPRLVRDGLIAATALVHGLTVVTRNAPDFEPTGVAVLNPWDDAPSTS